MIPTRTLRYSSALAMIQGLKQLFNDGLTPRGVLFLAFDSHGDVHLTIAERQRDVERLKVGEKLGLPPPLRGQYFYLDAVHPAGDGVVINGDRRIGRLASMVDVAAMVSWFVKSAQVESIFFGCTPHQPGSWWVKEERAVPLHDRGFVELVSTEQGLLARKILDDGLYFLERQAALSGKFEDWQRVFTSPFGNVLMLERRLLYDQLVLSCCSGLVEVDVYDLPAVSETGRLALQGGYAVVGRITGGAFAVARGQPMDWGFEGLGPAMLVGSEGCSFMELKRLLTTP